METSFHRLCVCFQVILAYESIGLCKCSGKYIDICFILKITFLYIDILLFFYLIYIYLFFADRPLISLLRGKSGVHIPAVLGFNWCFIIENDASNFVGSFYLLFM